MATISNICKRVIKQPSLILILLGVFLTVVSLIADKVRSELASIFIFGAIFSGLGIVIGIIELFFSSTLFTKIIIALSYQDNIVLKGSQQDLKITKPVGLNWLNLSYLLFSSKTQKTVFEPIVADWREEYFESLSKKEIWKARWIRVRYTYAFLAAMWMKSPIGDLIEFIQKIVK